MNRKSDRKTHDENESMENINEERGKFNHMIIVNENENKQTKPITVPRRKKKKSEMVARKVHKLDNINKRQKTHFAMASQSCVLSL